MVSRIRSLGLAGIGGYEVSAEISLSGGLPQFDIVGLPDAAVREARERVRASAKNCGYQFPVPKDYDENLRVVFGDYMQIPEPSKRDCHVAYKIEF